MRVWDVSPGYLNRGSLLGEHREIHAIFSIIINDKKGYAHHPETLRWRGHLGALARRHRAIVSEMALRGYRHHSPVAAGEGGMEWPRHYLDSPVEQFRLLAAKYRDREPGRIPLPRNVQQLWAQHKYSALARDPAFYRRVGSSLAHLEGGPELEALALSLVEYLRRQPSHGGLTNALQHMWGYVGEFARAEGLSMPEDPAALSEAVRRLALEHDVTYLLQSTALSDLHAWSELADYHCVRGDDG